MFNTFCKVEGKCCKLIVDSGSTDNLVSTKMVEKLKLRKMVYPEPYRVTWLQKGSLSSCERTMPSKVLDWKLS